MGKTFFYIILVIIIVFSGCENRGKTFSNRINLEGTKPELKNASYGRMPRFKIISDTILLVEDVYNNKYTLNLLHTENFHHIATTGKVGKGPREINSPGLIVSNPSTNSFLYLDVGKYKFFRFNFGDMLNRKKDYLPQKSNFKFKKAYMPAYNMKFFNDSTIIFNGSTGKNILYFMNSKEQIIKKIGKKFYNKPDNMPKIAYAMATKTHFDIKPDKSKIAIGYGLFNKLICLDTNGRKVFEFRENKEFNPNFKVKGQVITHQGLKIGYKKILTTENYIFGLYNGEVEYKKKNNQPYFNYPNEIHVLDWEGNAVAKLNLDREVYDFIIDKKRNRIIAFGTKKMNPFVIYKIPEELNLN